MLFDLDSIKQRLRNNLSSKTEWSNILLEGVNAVLLNTVAEEIYNLAQYDEYLTVENKFTLSQNRTSLVTQAGLLKYIPYRQTGAIGTLKVSAVSTFDDTPAVNISIPKYTEFSNGNNISYVTSNGYSLTTSDNYIEVSVVQGTPLIYNFFASGSLNEEFTITNDAIEENTFDLFINGVEWTNVDDLRLYGDQAVYEIENEPDYSGIRIKVGDGTYGRKLTAGDTVVFKCVQTLGETGDITSSGIVTTVESTIYNENGIEVDIYVTNESSLLGGLYIEEKESIRSNAPQNFQAGDIAVTKEGYEAIVNALSYVQKVTVWGEYEYNLDNGNPTGTYVALEENVVHMAVINTNDIQATTAQETLIYNSLIDIKGVTDIVQFEDIEFINLVFTTTAYISNRQYTLGEVKTNIESTLSTTYSLSNTNFKDNLYQSDYVGLLDDVEGVEFHTTAITLYYETTFNTPYEATIDLPLFNETESVTRTTFTTSSFSIYVKEGAGSYVKIGTDDGSGNFTAEAGYNLTGSSINYTTGEGNLVVVSGLSGTFSDYSIKIYYGIDNNDIVLSARNQIPIYKESNITTQYTLTAT